MKGCVFDEPVAWDLVEAYKQSLDLGDDSDWFWSDGRMAVVSPAEFRRPGRRSAKQQ